MKFQLTSQRKFAAFLLTLGLVFGAATATQAAVPHHLYVALEKIHQFGFQVLRYKLVNGLPERRPDMTFQNLQTPMAVGDDGTFYAAEPGGNSFYSSTIDVFPLGAEQPDRKVTLPSVNDFTVAYALAVGPGGYIYVGYFSYFSGAAPNAVDDDSQPDYAPRHGIAVFAPNAKHAHPVYKFPGIPGGPSWLQMGPQNELYAGGYKRRDNAGHIFTIAQPWTGPNIRQRLDTAGIDPIGITFSEETADMYVLAAGASSSFVNVYHRGAHGQQQPFRTFSVTGTQFPSLALVGKNLYMAGLSEVLAYPKDATGSPKPVVTRSFTGYYTLGVVAGP